MKWDYKFVLISQQLEKRKKRKLHKHLSLLKNINSCAKNQVEYIIAYQQNMHYNMNN